MTETTPDRIGRLARARGLTEEKLMGLAGLSAGTLSNARARGSQMTPRTLIPIARELGVPVDYLLHGKHPDIVEQDDADPCPNRAWAAKMHREMGDVSEEAIQEVLAETPDLTLSRRDWWRRMEDADVKLRSAPDARDR